MKVRILFFAMLREKMKTSEQVYEIEPEETVAALARRLLGSETSLLFAVNHEYVPSNYKLKAGDEVAFIPPVAGG